MGFITAEKAHRPYVEFQNDMLLKPLCQTLETGQILMLRHPQNRHPILK